MIGKGQVFYRQDPRKLGVSVSIAKNVVALYDTLKGEVANLEVGEKCTVELVDGYDRVLASTEIKHRGFKSTEWTMQLRTFSTMEMSDLLALAARSNRPMISSRMCGMASTHVPP